MLNEQRDQFEKTKNKIESAQVNFLRQVSILPANAKGMPYQQQNQQDTSEIPSPTV